MRGGEGVGGGSENNNFCLSSPDTEATEGGGGAGETEITTPGLAREVSHLPTGSQHIHTKHVSISRHIQQTS